MQNIVGIDIGGSHITLAQVDPEKHEIITSTYVREACRLFSQIRNNFHAWRFGIEKAVGNLRKENYLLAYRYAAGPFDYENGVSLMLQGKFRPNEVNIKKNWHAVEINKNQIHFINDAAAFLEGEVFGGCVQGHGRIFGVTLGTGLGTTFYNGTVATDEDLWNSPFHESICEDYLATRWFVNRYAELTGETITGAKDLLDKPEELRNKMFDEYADSFAEFILNMFDFPKTDNAYVVIDALDKGSYIKILPKEKKIIGYTTRYAAGKYENFKNYFVVQFDKNFDLTSAWKVITLVNDQLEITSNHAGAIVGFKLKAKESVYAKVASSFISFEQAEINLKREIGNQSFAQVKSNAKDIWSKTLGKIEVKGGTDEQYRTFYSAMYRTLFFPQKLYEIDAQNKIKHWSPYNGKILDGRMFAGTGFWDTFRALYPFLNLVYPSINVEMQEGLANAFKEGGFLPEWSSPGFANVMIGNNSASVVADAYIKGLRGYDIETLWKAVVHGANNEGPMDAVGRRGVSYYNSLGYVPYDVQINENAARTLEYAYDDFAIYQLGKALGKPESEIGIFKKRAYNYKNLFDSENRTDERKK
ncbi:hypothetical protein FQR65_LT16794 [Abscondita terminalis]|nr:hypothetical protein FQR65_LT16794 [Abscondita terminalis]